jgi:protein involved in polysaccharide export with SLBB domain
VAAKPPALLPRLAGRRLGALLLCACCLAACADLSDSCGPSAGAHAATGYRLGAGDQVRVTVFRQPDLSGTLQVGGQGYLAMPLVGAIAADGLTTQALQETIETKLREGGYLVDPDVSIEVLTYRPIYILGQVVRPGRYEYRNGMTVINAVALAGGYTPRAKTSEVTIRRAGCTFIAQPDAGILPDAVITVPERFI